MYSEPAFHPDSRALRTVLVIRSAILECSYASAQRRSRVRPRTRFFSPHEPAFEIPPANRLDCANSLNFVPCTALERRTSRSCRIPFRLVNLAKGSSTNHFRWTQVVAKFEIGHIRQDYRVLPGACAWSRSGSESRSIRERSSSTPGKTFLSSDRRCPMRKSVQACDQLQRELMKMGVDSDRESHD